MPQSFSIIVPAPAITKLAFRGGGAKGAAYPGALAALIKLRQLQQIDTVVGASVGAMTALFVALGCSPEEIETLTSELNFYKFLDCSSINFIANGGFCDGEVLYKTFQKIIEDKIKAHIVNLKEIIQAKIINYAATPILEELNAINEKNVTFADLGLLRRLYKRFTKNNMIKDLLIAGTNISDNKLDVFSEKSTSDMEIATAIRISASYPIVFKPVEYNGKLYMDGGAMDNLPVRALTEFSHEREITLLSDKIQRAKTLSFMLKREHAHGVIHRYQEAHKVGIIETLKIYFSKLILKVNATSNYSEFHQVLRDDYGLRTIPLHTGAVTTLTTVVSAQERNDLKKSSYRETEEYFASRVEEAVHYREDDLISCLLQLESTKTNRNIYKYIAQPLLDENPDSSEEQKEKIYHYAKGITNKVYKLNRQKKTEATELLIAVKELIALIADLKEHQSRQNNKRVLRKKNTLVKKAIQQVQKLYEQYLTFTDFQTNMLSTNPRHREILNERLQSTQSNFNQLLNSLAHYNTSAPEGFAIHQGVRLTNSLKYFQLQKKKAEIIKVLMESKTKYFQRGANIKLLSSIIHSVREAKSFEDIERDVNKTRMHYKPRTFFSTQSSSSFRTITELDKLIAAERTYSVEKQNLQNFIQKHAHTIEPIDDFDLIIANRNRLRNYADESQNIIQGTSLPALGVTPYNMSDSIQYAKGMMFGDRMSVNQTAKVAPIGKMTQDHCVGVNKGELIVVPEEKVSDEKLKVLFAGDLMVSGSGIAPSLDEEFLNEIRSADAFVVNVESPVNFNEGSQSRGLGLGFEMSKSYLAAFVKKIKVANPDIKIVYNIANNHALDGNDGVAKLTLDKEKILFESDPKNYILLRTIAAINEIDPDGVVIGAHAMKNKSLVNNDPIGVLDIKGIRLGLLGFTDVMNWNAKYWDRRVYRSEDIPENLMQVKRELDLDYICPFGHGSLEQSIYPTRHWRDLLLDLIKRGANLIVGHGPHVPQTNEISQGKLLIHSLGNLFGPKKLIGTGLNMLVKVEFSKSSINFEMLPVEASVNKEGVPLIRRITHPEQTVYPHLMTRLQNLFPSEIYPARALQENQPLMNNSI
jgi:predicted acylesterase/phospholipase RssA